MAAVYPDLADKVVRRLKRRLTPDEVAKFTAVLPSDEASACSTAQHYVADGGWD
jgi:NAD(P)-dependent dehydrogenase (short-subunit alcohol dehydrogenase family)